MFKNCQRGFSLVEILIAIGLISIIATISIPNYLKYTRGAKTAEAQSSLGQIYMAEKSFYLQWRFYTVDLVVAGVAPDGGLLYNAGFTGSGSAPPSTYQGPPINSGRKTLFNICGSAFGSGAVKGCAFRVKKQNNYIGFTPPSLTGSYDVSPTTFTAGAIADLISKIPDGTGTTKRDIWSINNYKQIKRLEDGT